MKILLAFEDDFPIDKNSLTEFVQQKTHFIDFILYKENFSISDKLIIKPDTFINIQSSLNIEEKDYDKIFCFTIKQYNDNYFYHEYSNLIIFSFYSWNYLTSLPFSNGVLYFIVNYLARKLDNSSFRHKKLTGCIYDHLDKKTGVDDGMRQSGFCQQCLDRISNSLINNDDIKIFDDLKTLMNELSNSSKWNNDILSIRMEKSKLILKRRPKKEDCIRVIIASPGDTTLEREYLLTNLEVKFRRNNHEENCGFRIVVDGWEDLASQPGYPQDVINEKLINESDFIVAIFRHKLGTPTKNIETGKLRAESGTAEELLQTLNQSNESHPIGMAYFFSKAPQIFLDDPNKTEIEREWERLSKFKKSIQDKMIYKPYTDKGELISLCSTHKCETFIC